MAVAAVIAHRKKGGSVGLTEGDANLVEDKLPPVEIREADMFLGLQLGGAWQRRRVIFTKEIIAFADEEVMIDHILLSEVEFVRDVGPTDDDLQVEHGKLENAFMVSTFVHGRNSGRTYCLQAESKAHCNQIVENLSKSAAAARQRAEAKTRFARLQQKVKLFFDSSVIQAISASLILLNFLVSIVDAQFGPDVVHDEDYTDKQMTISKLADMSGSFNSAFTAIFTVELFLNIFGNGFRRFMASGWNWLDLFIVSMSLVDLVVENIPAWLVGLMRAIRVIRLFGRVKELKKMSTAVTASVFPMMNAFVILIVILCIFSILGVSLFSKGGPDEFGRFNRAFITCFRMVTGDSWPESLPMLRTDGAIDVKASLFFCSFSIVVAWIILQVSVAVLIDNFVAASSRLENEAKMKIVMEKKKVNMYKNPLEPLIAKLAMSYVDRADLEEKLKALFQSLDSDGSGDLSSTEFCAAIRKLNFTPCIYMTEPDFRNLSRNGALCNQDGTIDCERFRYIMMEQIRAYTMTLLTVHSTYLTPEEEEFSRRGTLKMIMMDQQQMQDRMDRSSPKGKSEERVLDAKIGSTSKKDSCVQNGCFEAESGSMASSDTTQPASTHFHDISQEADAAPLARTELAELRELMHSTCRFVCLGDESAKLHLLHVLKLSTARGDKGGLDDSAPAKGGGSNVKARRSLKHYHYLADESARDRVSRSFGSASTALRSPKLEMGEIQEQGCSFESNRKMTCLTRWKDYASRKQASVHGSKNSFQEQEASPCFAANESAFTDEVSREHEFTSTSTAAVSSGEYFASHKTSGNSIAGSSLQLVPSGSAKTLRSSSSFSEKTKQRASPNDGISTRDPNLESTVVAKAKRTSSQQSSSFKQNSGRLSRSINELFGGSESCEFTPDWDPNSRVRPLVRSRSLTEVSQCTNLGAEEHFLQEQLDAMIKVSNTMSTLHDALEAPAQLPGPVPSPLTRAGRLQHIGQPEVRLEQSKASLTEDRVSRLSNEVQRKGDKNVLDVVHPSRRSKRDSSSRGISDSTTLVPGERFSRKSSDMPRKSSELPRKIKQDHRYDDLQWEDDYQGPSGNRESWSETQVFENYRERPCLEDGGEGYNNPTSRVSPKWDDSDKPRYQRSHDHDAESVGWGQSWASLDGWGAATTQEELAESQTSRGARRKSARATSVQAAHGMVQPRRSDLVKVTLI